MIPPEADDEYLAGLAKNGDEEALERLLARYKPLMRSLAARYFIRGGDHDDVVQEAMIGLFKAVQSFDPGEGARFAAVAARRSEQAIIDAVRKAEAKKNSILNESVSLENYVPSTGDEWLGGAEPEPRAEESETNLARALEGLELKLSPLELNVLKMRLKDKSYREIAETLEVSTKAVDNALQRIRLKLKENDEA